MTLSFVKNGAIGSLLLLILITACVGYHALGQMVQTLTRTVEVHNPSRTALVRVSDDLQATGERFSGYLNRDRISAVDVVHALEDLNRRGAILAEELRAAGNHAVEPFAGIAGMERAFREHLERAGAGFDRDRLAELFAPTAALVAEVRDSTDMLLESSVINAVPRSLELALELTDASLRNLESTVDRYRRLRDDDFSLVVQPVSEAIAIVNRLLTTEQEQIAGGQAGSVQAARALESLRESLIASRAALFDFVEEDMLKSNPRRREAAEQAFRRHWQAVNARFDDVSRTLDSRNERAQRASIEDGQRWQTEFLWLGAGAFLIGVAFATVFGRFVNARLRPVIDGARRFSEGELTHRIHVDVDDELGELARTYNGMARRIEHRDRALGARLEALNRANREVRESNRHLDRLIDAIPDPLILVDGTGAIVKTNRAVHALAGRDGTALAGAPLEQVLQLADARQPAGADTATEGEFISATGERIPMSVSTAVATADDRAAPGTLIIAKDARAARWAERRRAMKYTVSQLLAEGGSLDEVMPEVLGTLGVALGYVCGAYWRWDEARGVLVHEQSWSDGSPGLEDFLGCQADNDPTRPGGFIRQVWNTREPLWVEDFGAETGLHRARHAAAANLHGALAVPVTADDAMYGVLELFSHDYRRPDEELLEDCHAICSRIGQFSKRQEAETALREKTERLEASNRELDQFAYVTSHDLKAPLRAIVNLAQWIEEDLGEHLTPEIGEHMDLLRGRVHRMEGLIQGILEYSRIGREAVRRDAVDLDELLGEVIDSLPVPDGFRIQLADDLPVLHAPRVRLHQVFANLIGNAIKYHDRDDGCVTLSVRDAGDWYEFAIEDDGPGIPQEYHEKVFGIFQTLEARDKVESTGIGLTLVKKIVEEQGGHINLSPRTGRGACFQFTWPADRKAA